MACSRMNLEKYQSTCTGKKAPDNSEVHRSLQNCGSSVWHLLHVTLWAPGIWRWLLDFWKNLWNPGLNYQAAKYTNSKRDSNHQQPQYSSRPMVRATYKPRGHQCPYPILIPEINWTEFTFYWKSYCNFWNQCVWCPNHFMAQRVDSIPPVGTIYPYL
jgi:hypothetical protein